MSAQEISTLPGPATAETLNADGVCPRYKPGSIVPAPPELKSSNGVLKVTFKFWSVVDSQGLLRYCYASDNGYESPTLRVNPGDTLMIHFQNELTPAPRPTANDEMAGMKMNPDVPGVFRNYPCNGVMNPNVTNLHFHGTNTSPVCGQDNVTTLLIQPGQNFDYRLKIPLNEPPGMYWYHPHAHGYAEMQVQGGASGVLIVEGLQNVDQALQGLPERTFVLRDQALPNSELDNTDIPAWDLSINYVPVTYPAYTPAIIQTPAAEKELWRVANNSADTIMNLQYTAKGAPLPMEVVAIDGVPIAAGSSGKNSTTQTSILLAPGSRAEFVITTPGAGLQAQLTTQSWDTGPDGDFDPTRTIANVVSAGGKPTAIAQDSVPVTRLPAANARPQTIRFAELNNAISVAQRTLYFSEILSDPNDPASPTNFFITEEGEEPAVFTMGQAPNIVVHSGSVEDWVVENRSLEDHVFHIHQIHFQVLEANGQAINDPALRDTVDVPYWSGNGPYPSVKLHMDFRDPNIVGDFVFHCHILAHEDGGMMGVIRVLPTGHASITSASVSTTRISTNVPVRLAATVRSQAGTSPSPQGQVQFQLSGNNIGNPVSLIGGRANLTTVISGPVGTGNLTAFYEGDNYYAESASRATQVIIKRSDN